jgi:hypothetical protein
LLAEANGKIEVAHTNALQYEHRIGELSGQLMVINRLVDQWATRPPSASEVGGAKSNLAKASVMTRQFQTNLAARVTLLQPVKPKLSSLEALNRAATKR